MDLEKLKVVDLRKELQQRGLDTKGNKAVLIKRLKEALDEESSKGTEQKPSVTKDPDEDSSNNDEDQEEAEESTESVKKEVKQEKVTSPKKEVKSEPSSPEKKPKVNEESSKKEQEDKAETNGDESKNDEEASEEAEKEEKMETETRGEKRKRDDDNDEAEAEDTEARGEKRRREDKASPEKAPPKKVVEKVPPKEDEPEIDYEKPQLSWYDSDLHLQVEKKTFLSAKPLNDGCMGYIWAGARATHGVSSGKVCFEVKITEELKWEDLSKFMQERKGGEIPPRDKYRIDRRKEKIAKADAKKEETKKEGDEKSSEEKEKSGEATEETEKSNEEKMEAEDSEKTAVEDKEDKEKSAEEDKEKAVEEDKEKEKSDDNETNAEEAKDGEQTTDKKEDGGEKMDTDQKVEKPEEKPKEIIPIPTHYFRVGFSMLGSTLQLGEDKLSFGYQSTGKFITNKEFQDYGVAYGAGDVVGAYVDINDENVTITYTVNGALQPTAVTVPRSEFPEENFALFPHVLCRNYAYELNFGANAEPWFAAPEELKDYKFLQDAEDKVSGPKRPETRADCEVILMIGLPGVGKTTWVRNHIESTTDKSYTIIGNSPIFDRMTVDGEPLKTKFTGSWKVLVDKIQKCLNILTDIAALRRRNFIIDQTNVFPNAQRRKLRAFEGFKRRAVCILCDDEEHARRQKEHENDYGKTVPESTMFDLKAQMELPKTCEWLEELVFPELNEEESRNKLKVYTEEANKKGYFRRWHTSRDDRGKNRPRKPFIAGGRFDRYQGGWNKPAVGGWGAKPGGGGGWGGRDRRDMRAPARFDSWRDNPRGGGRYAERDSRPRDNRSAGGYGGSRGYNTNRSADVWQGSGANSGWGAGNSQGGWNAQMYGSHGYGAWNQQGWKPNYGGGAAAGGQGNYGGGQSAYGGGYGAGAGGQAGYGQQSWNYYGQYGNNQQQQGWGNQAQPRGRGGGQTAYSQQDWIGPSIGSSMRNNRLFLEGHNVLVLVDVCLE